MSFQKKSAGKIIETRHLLMALALLLVFAQLAVASNAIIAYSSDTGSGDNYPKIKFWNSSGSGSWGPEYQLPSTGSQVIYAIVKSSPVSDKIVLVTLNTNRFLNA